MSLSQGLPGIRMPVKPNSQSSRPKTGMKRSTERSILPFNSVKAIQQMPTPRPQNTEHYTSAILSTPEGVRPTAEPRR